MKHVGIICEYNPFHGGHAYQISTVRGEADTVIALMSGNFTQRGEAAFLPPVPRATAAIPGGADLVLELPFPFSAASARHFATAGVRALSALGADTLLFGSETGELSTLLALAENAPDGEYRVGQQQSRGDAAAYFDALGVGASSNDILAIEYLRAILKTKSEMRPLAVRRAGSAYLDTALDGVKFASATALRAAWERGEDVSSYLPSAVFAVLADAVQQYGIAKTDALGAPMLARLRCLDEVPLDAEIAECGGGLLGRLVKSSFEAEDYASLCALATTKRYTTGRIRRTLLYLLAGVTREDLVAPPAYLRLLAANKKGRDFLAATAKTRQIPVVTKQSEIAALGERAARQRLLARRADGLYALCLDGVTPHDLQTAKPYFVT